MNRRVSFALAAFSDPFISVEDFFVAFLRIGEGIGDGGITVKRIKDLTQYFSR